LQWILHPTVGRHTKPTLTCFLVPSNIQAGPVQPGLLTFIYEKITTNLLGMQNLGVGFFGLLKGRANYVQSTYFDGIFWIERGVPISGEGDFINVYMRMDN
jgi:hypothetical protein